MFKRSIITLSMLSLLPITSLFAAEGSSLPFELFNRLRVEYDDNVRQEKTEEDESFKIIEDLELILNTQQNNTFLGLRYNPSFVWWDDRDEDDTDVHHQFDLALNQEFNERFQVSVKDVFRLSELPELIESGVVSREKNDYIYNSALGTASLRLTDAISVAGNARYIILDYDDNAIGANSDYDKFVLGADLTYAANPKTQVGAEFRFSDVEYDADERNSDSYQVGGMLKSILSPKVQANLRAGFEHKDFESANTGSSDTPYVSGSIVFSASDLLQFNAGGSFSFADTAFAPFVNQERAAVFAGSTLQVSSRVKANVGVSYATSSYEADDTTSSTDVNTVNSGDEEVLRISAQATYEVNPSNWLQIGWQGIDLSSDVRPSEEYNRNRAHVGWKVKI